ncbi:hypothetical protein BSU01_23780 [Erwinia billingiae]|uniref:hypothetical protein n=1 Tax=Erwinia billingiae TaxID=182337 RepID=UPI0019CFE064|nr:hypothetical protein [Erwinia billingiae]MBN7124694.1 hypothetical protein [Erwinia billingiae]
MKNFTVAEVEDDLSMIMDNFNSRERYIPSSKYLLKASGLIPLVSILLSFISNIFSYMSVYSATASLEGFFYDFMTDGWVVVLPTAVIGMFFTFITYNNVLIFMSVPEGVRRKSVVLNHLASVTRRIVILFLMLMLFSAFLSTISPRYSFAIPALELVLLFFVNFIISAEVNRLGAGLALEKISKLINKI